MGQHKARKGQRSSVLGYVVGSALGAVALGLTAWIALRNREKPDTEDAEAQLDQVVDEDLV